MNRQMKRAAVPVIVGMALGGLAGWRMGLWLKGLGAFHLSAWMLMVLPVVVLLALALHEAGHVTAGLIGGFEFRLFVAGPLRVERHDGRLKASFNRNSMLWGGIAGCVPKHYGADLAGKMILFVAGGPLFSLLGALCLIPGFWFLHSHTNASFLLVTFGLISVAVGMMTLLPLRMGGFTSDGMRLAMLMRSRPEGQRWTAMAALGGLSQTVRPRDWPAELMALLGDGGLNSQAAETDAAMACLMWHVWHSDRREFGQARMWLERALTHADAMPAAMLPILYQTAAHYYARHSTEKALARQYFDLAQKPGLQDADTMHAVRAAVLVAEGRASEARSELEMAERKLRLKPPAVAQWLREDIHELRALIN